MSQELERELEQALDQRLRRAPVDGESLLVGARKRAHRIRRRRQQAVAVLAVGAVLGAGSLGWLVRAGTDEVVQAASPSLSTPLKSPVPEATGSPAPSDGASPSSLPTEPLNSSAQKTAVPGAPQAPVVDFSELGADELAFELPDSVLPGPGDLPGLAAQEVMRYRKVPAVMGMQCNLGEWGVEPITGMSQMWYESMTSVDITVTGYSRGTGATIWEELRTDTGYCRWMDSADVVEGTSAEGFPMITRDEAEYAQRVIRIGDVLVGVQARATGQDPAVATRIAELTAQRVAAQNVTGTGG